MPSKKDQQNFWSFYPSEPFQNGHFNVRHPVSEISDKLVFLCKTLKNNNDELFKSYDSNKRL